MTEGSLDERNAFVAMQKFYNMLQAPRTGDYTPRIAQMFEAWINAGDSISKTLRVLRTPVDSDYRSSRLSQLLDNLCGMTKAQKEAALAQKAYYESKL